MRLCALLNKQAYNKHGPNLTGSIRDFASGTHGLLALKQFKGEVGGCLSGNVRNQATVGVYIKGGEHGVLGSIYKEREEER